LQDERLTQADYHRLKECLTISQLVEKTAQQSVHLTGGIRRIFQAVFLALMFTTIINISTPVHQQVTQTVMGNFRNSWSFNYIITRQSI
jgi:hypothetical protein